ncbi:hypothetical protein KI688_006342 [Linnemannia hyalina]|uniref:Protein kinase domain-containing protein n=1 Tax=Linnemannia hyalina TaxID=64524 RepID=A0A9P7Y5C5_9FUNG|nr:hypothetical protein KI688_006342 [Linnemannia hyalina]
MGSNRPAARNQRAKLAADLNDLFKDLQSNQVKTVGNYHLGQLVGQGTYGKVKLATHALTGQQVAVKIVAKSHAAIITREIYHWRCLTHPYIAHLHEVLTTESKIYLVTEYCPKGELLEALIRDGRCKPSLAKRWFRQICLAIQYCHSRKIVHRDLKLENILLDSQNNIKLIDFGFTRECESKKLLESYCGSAAYTAPEIIVGKKYSGPEADIWSLGVILYTLLAGYLPFDDDNETVVQDKIVDLDYEMPNELFCKDAQDLIQSILKEDPKERFTIEQILAHSWWMPRSDDDEEGGGSGAAGEGDGKLSMEQQDAHTGHGRQGSLTKREIHPVASQRPGDIYSGSGSPQFPSPLAQYPYGVWGNQSPYTFNPLGDMLRASSPGGPPVPSPISSPLPSPSPMVNKSFPRFESAGTMDGNGSAGARIGGSGSSYFPANSFEQRLLMVLEKIGLDAEIFSKSVPAQSCDPGYGLWCLLMEQVKQRAIDNGTSLEWEQSIALVETATLTGVGSTGGIPNGALAMMGENGKKSPRPMSDPSPTSSQVNLLLPQISIQQQTYPIHPHQLHQQQQEQQQQQQQQQQDNSELQRQTVELKELLDKYKLEAELLRVEKQQLEKEKISLAEVQPSKVHPFEMKELPPISAEALSGATGAGQVKPERPVQDSGVSVSTSSTPHSSWELTERDGPTIHVERPRRKSKGILHSLKDRFFSSTGSDVDPHSGHASPHPPSPIPPKAFTGSPSSSTNSGTTYASPKPLPAPPAHPYPHLLQHPTTHSPLSAVSYKSASTSSLAIENGQSTTHSVAARAAASSDQLSILDPHLDHNVSQYLDPDTPSTHHKKGGFMTWISESASGTVLNKTPVVQNTAKVPKKINGRSYSTAEAFADPSSVNGSGGLARSPASSSEENRPQIPAIPASFFQPIWKSHSGGGSAHGSASSLPSNNGSTSSSTLATSAPSGMSIRQRLASFSSSTAKITPEERQRATAAAAAAAALVAQPSYPERAHSPSPPSSPRGPVGSNALAALGGATPRHHPHRQDDEINEIVAAAVAATASAHLKSSGSRKKNIGTTSSGSKKNKTVLQKMERTDTYHSTTSTCSTATATSTTSGSTIVSHSRRVSDASRRQVSAPSLQIPSSVNGTGPPFGILKDTGANKDVTRKPSIKASKASMPSLMTAFSSFKPSKSAPSSPVVNSPSRISRQQLPQDSAHLPPSPSVDSSYATRTNRSSRASQESSTSSIVSGRSRAMSNAMERPLPPLRNQDGHTDVAPLPPLKTFGDGVVIQEHEVRPKKRTTSRTSITAASLSRRSNESSGSLISAADRSEPSSPITATTFATATGITGGAAGGGSTSAVHAASPTSAVSPSKRASLGSLSSRRSSTSSMRDRNIFGLTLDSGSGSRKSSLNLSRTSLSKNTFQSPSASPGQPRRGAEMERGERERYGQEDLASAGTGRASPLALSVVEETQDDMSHQQELIGTHSRTGLNHNVKDAGRKDMFPMSAPSSIMQSRSGVSSVTVSNNSSTPMAVVRATLTDAITYSPSISASSSLSRVAHDSKTEAEAATAAVIAGAEEALGANKTMDDAADVSFGSGSTTQPRLDFTDGRSLIPSPPPSPSPLRPNSIRNSAAAASAIPVAVGSDKSTSAAAPAPAAPMVMNRRSAMLEEPRTSLLSTSYPPPRASLSYSAGAAAAVAAAAANATASSTSSSTMLESTSPPSPLSSRPLVSFDQHFSNQARIKEHRDSTTPRKVVNGFQPLAAKRLSKPGWNANNNANNSTAEGPSTPQLNESLMPDHRASPPPPSAMDRFSSSFSSAHGPPNAFAGRNRRGYRNSTGSMANMTLQQQQTFQQLQKEQLLKIQQNLPNAGYETTAAMKIHGPRPRTGMFPKRELGSGLGGGGGGALGGLGGLGGAGVPSHLGSSSIVAGGGSISHHNNGSQSPGFGTFETVYETSAGSAGNGVGSGPGVGKRDSYSNRRQSMATAMGKRAGATPAAIQEEEES